MQKMVGTVFTQATKKLEELAMRGRKQGDSTERDLLENYMKKEGKSRSI